MNVPSFARPRLTPVPVAFLGGCVALVAGIAAASGVLPAVALLVLLVLGVPFALWYARSLHVGLVLVLLAMLPGQLVRISLGTDARGGSAILLADLCIGLLLLVWCIRKLAYDQRFEPSRTGGPLALFTGVALLSLVQGFANIAALRDPNAKDALVAAMYWLRWVEYALLFFVFLDAVRSVTAAKRYVHLLVWIAVILAIGGFFQVVLYPDMTQLAIAAGWDPHQGRLVSSFFDPNFMGSFFAIPLTLLLVELLTPGKTNRQKVVYGLATAILGVGLLLTFSRGGLLSFLAAFVVVGLLRSPRTLVVGLLIIFVSIASVPRLVDRIVEGASVDETGLKRIESWTKALKLLPNYPLLGTGYGALAPVQDRLGLVDEFDVNNRGGVENSFLTIAVTTGLLGFLAYLFLWIAMLSTAFRTWVDTRLPVKLRHFGLGMFAVLVGLIFSSLTLNSLLYPFILIPLWMLMALLERRIALGE